MLETAATSQLLRSLLNSDAPLNISCVNPNVWNEGANTHKPAHLTRACAVDSQARHKSRDKPLGGSTDTFTAWPLEWAIRGRSNGHLLYF